MARPKITLYVDTVSPFAYQAYYILRNDPIFKNVDITYIPIFLGGLMHKCGNTAPIKIKNKDKWINIERLRWSRLFSIPMLESLPPDFPAPTLPVMRALTAVYASEQNDSAQPKFTRALDALFKAHWVDGQATHRPEELKKALAEIFGAEEADKIIKQSATPEVKQLLIQNTDRAFDEGAFGLPWLTCTNADGKTEGFWGVDHLGQAVVFLGLDKGTNNGWRAVL
ncbi:uncharacterized protein CTHT_0002970 [Thermochaetoides thermophila DSM 1495]|uniref:Glutathione S-transferase kappa n=1 Tax=Chaetomium thermophilum (strain DSM 1495 / CBS 144.50 / IMI 039719) TaxID=759272 RepID=G0RZH4_CHATD|nr:hypothetical protein CTHT_0002970 [Thermochaetoides thermophila DSM 1495]EGS23602.1 hypothetical protein CTHT_0002970 [Thermochaetoides thermophila DSM 1495]